MPCADTPPRTHPSFADEVRLNPHTLITDLLTTLADLFNFRPTVSSSFEPVSLKRAGFPRERRTRRFVRTVPGTDLDIVHAIAQVSCENLPTLGEWLVQAGDTFQATSSHVDGSKLEPTSRPHAIGPWFSIPFIMASLSKIDPYSAMAFRSPIETHTGFIERAATLSSLQVQSASAQESSLESPEQAVCGCPMLYSSMA